jgi:hypothetical protein
MNLSVASSSFPMAARRLPTSLDLPNHRRHKLCLLAVLNVTKPDVEQLVRSKIALRVKVLFYAGKRRFF